MKRSELLALVGGGLLSTLGMVPAFARNDGDYRIQRAVYGTPERFVDVTDRLRELAQRDARFRLGNDTFGVDPARGEVKALRIEATSRSGRSRTFEYVEGAVVDGAMFEGWRGGGWGQGGGQGGWGGRPGYNDGRDGEYQILRAQYGTAQRNVDVTNRLRELAQRDERFRLSNRTFGTDPHPGQVKVLRIHARGPRGTRTFEYVEGSMVDGSQFTGWRAGGWGQGDWNGGWGGDEGPTRGLVILRAEYGTGGRWVDITDRLQARVVLNRLNVRVNNDLAGDDPAPNRPKELRVRFQVDGREQRRTVSEGQRLSLP
jgi:hypothetical protein